MTARATIRRGPSPSPRKRKPVVRGGRRPQKPSARKATKLGLLLQRIPVPVATLRRIGNWGLALLLLCGVIAGAVAMKLPQMLGTQAGELAGNAGFAVRHIEVSGIRQMDRSTVYAIAADQQSRALPLADLGAIRGRLLEFGWIADARVSRRYPDTLAIDIVERRPAAVWQYQRRLALIDETGTVIAPVPLDRMPNLPLLIGPEANRQTASLARLTSVAPQLRPVMAGATWVGGRRWDLRFLSGETLALPEGAAPAAAALAEFARLDGRTRLLGRGFVRFDMRIPGSFVVRVSKEPGHSVLNDVATLKRDSI
ncbi:MAG: cell division protein FtsQ/DivIB [Sphingomonas sp.]